MNAVATSVRVEEYLATSYDPDCEFVDGHILERNLGKREHSVLQDEILAFFRDRRKLLRLRAFPEHRIQVGPTRFRVPDVTVMHLPVPDEPVITTPPYICIEILSPEDTVSRMRERVDDYKRMGVENIWLIDSMTLAAYIATSAGLLDVTDGVLRTRDGKVEMPISSLRTEYDQ